MLMLTTGSDCPSLVKTPTLSVGMAVFQERCLKINPVKYLLWQTTYLTRIKATAVLLTATLLQTINT
jgi:hypothetical protein